MNETITRSTSKYTMICKTSELLDVMRFLSKAVPKYKKGIHYSCEVTIKTNEVIFVTIGATRVLFCKSTGPMKISIPFLYFYDIIKNIRTVNTKISIGEGLMTIGNLTVNISTCFFQDDTILRSINLPMNYSAIDILRLSILYTPEEIKFNNMVQQVKIANAEIEKDINLTYGILKKYGVTTDEIGKIVHQKIFDKKPKFN